MFSCNFSFYFGMQENCQNYIRILNVVTPGKILVCGTNAYKPRCRYYVLSANGQHYTHIGAEKSGQGICPYDPKHNSTSTFVGKYPLLEKIM